ncbi:MAG: helix-turn-helix domain-containing protein [Saprospiraceae bacterium]|jgi:transposase-like protein|nr:helix-turn-helix domain-containing protein [Saprospiraceae bacterium]MBK8054016.1 helix-turn-helix domain-containing protein [Saprospiraceae bacterium]
MENKKKERMSTNKKTELVLQLLRGESLDELCRIHHVSASQLSEWRDIFVSKGKEGFRKSSDDHRLREAQAIIGRQAIELDLYKKKMVLIRQIKEK